MLTPYFRKIFVMLAGVTVLGVCGTPPDILAGNGYPANGTETEGNCLFSQQLKDPYYREDFDMQLAHLRNPADPMSSGSEEENLGGIDALSFSCISCHDGTNAPGGEVRVKNNPTQREITLRGVKGSHPIGMDYESYAINDRKLRGAGALNKEMIFVNGKVGCLTCHNPLNPKKKHLVMENEYSALCLTCHDK